MAHAHLTPNAINYNATISCCGKGGQWEQALELLSCLQEAELADVVGFNATISACERSGSWEEAIQVLLQMPESSVVPDVISC